MTYFDEALNVVVCVWFMYKTKQIVAFIICLQSAIKKKVVVEEEMKKLLSLLVQNSSAALPMSKFVHHKTRALH